MKHLKIFISVISYLAILNPVISQTFPQKDYPKNYFRNPLGIPINLAANFGELRNNHFHMGLDIRTNQRENLPVYAAAEGYVSRIKIEQYGFGRAIYITHPNGYTTLYAHLNEFFPALEKHLETVQYRTESWEQDLYLAPQLFPVTKGQFIANSGNTGGSAGPHLHFEIRETYTENNLNPLLFGLPVTDNVKPFFRRLYLYDRRFSTYDKPPIPVGIKKVGSNYTTLAGTVTAASPLISFGINAEDRSNASFNFGIYQAELFVDDVLKNAFRMNDFSYPDSRYINASVDYATKAKTGAWIQHLSRLPGNESPIFLREAGNGVIDLSDGEVHNIQIKLTDVSNNVTNLQFKIKYQPSASSINLPEGARTLEPGRPNYLAFDNASIAFGSHALYDTVHFVYGTENSGDANGASDVYQFHNYTVPVHDSFTVRIKASENLPASLRNRVVAHLESNKKTEALKGNWNNGFMEVKFRDLGEVQLLVDTISPRLQTIGWSSGANLRGKKSITFLADDNLGDLASFRAELDGKWLMFSRKKDYFIHHFDERTTSGNHELKVWVRDQAGNTTEKTYSFTR